VPIASVPDHDDTAAPPTAAPEEAGRAAGRSLGAFQRGTLSGRNLASAPFEGSDDT
jgi:hypothetical protein